MTIHGWLNRLGFWNRLALVAAVLVTLVWPTWRAVAENRRQADALDAGFDICLAARAHDVDAFDACWDIWLAGRTPAVDLDAWGIYTSLTALGCLAAYGVLWLLTRIGQWVWRGRSQKNTDTA